LSHNNKRKSKRKKIGDSVVLVVLDGWGVAEEGEYNAISLAKTPNFDQIKRDYGSIEISASGKSVGLTEGQMGNSEVGHLTIGSGRIIFQDLMRVSEEISSGRLARNSILQSALMSVKRRESALHLMGLVSDGGVHSHIEHLFALLKIAKSAGLSRMYVHVFLDGRDTPPKSGIDHISALQRELESLGVGAIATVSGRYYAMDRDARWDRTKLAYDAIVYGEGPRFDDAISSIKKSYEDGVTDEFVLPKVIGNYAGIKNGDAIIFFNFRPDRARQLTRALSQSKAEFKNLFDRREEKRPKSTALITMTVYDAKFKNAKPLLGRERVASTLSNVLEKESIPQLRIAETEKYAHVTYFFNGLVEKPRKFEDRILIPSLKVDTYDKSPEMSAREIARNAVKAIDEGKYGFILINFANADMVGHSGNVEATVRAVETVDDCLGKIYNAWKSRKHEATLIVTADHGNAEKLYDEKTGQLHTAHTSNPVPFVIVSEKWKVNQSFNGRGGLRDVSPTVLQIMNLKKPLAMTGESMAESRAPKV